MKGTPMSLWLSMVNRAVGWWAGTARAAAQQNAHSAAGAGKRQPKLRRKPARKRRR
jgi:hypothetical protein